MKVFVQIGSNKGKDLFQSKIEELEDPAIVVLVEPNPNILEELKASYTHLESKHKIHICNKAISYKNETVPFYLYKTGDTHSSLLHRKSHDCIAEQLEVEAVTFDELCNIYKVQDVEMLFIDTEGADCEIINSIDFSKHKIKNLIFEQWPIDEDDKNENFRTGDHFFKNNIKQKLEEFFVLKETINDRHSIQNLFYTAKED